MKNLQILIIMLAIASIATAQRVIPIDTINWDISAKAYVLENFNGQDAIYLQAGSITLKNREFLNGTIEYEVYLKNEQAFPGVYFRSQKDTDNAEHFYLRPHLSGKEDGTQATALIHGISPWQLDFGPKYSFSYDYKYDRWTHVKLVVNENKAQVFMDGSEKPSLSWYLFHAPKKGLVTLNGGNASGMHLANISISEGKPELKDFNPIERKPIEGLIPNWQVSDKFEEKLLDNPQQYDAIINSRKWLGNIQLEEGTAANISRKVVLRDGTPGNTVFAKTEIESDRDQLKLFEFGYSDRVVVILNGVPLYRGNNNYRSRDYRYLGTIGLFDAVYLPLKKGKNVLLMAVSENFGGWLVTGRLQG